MAPVARSGTGSQIRAEGSNEVAVKLREGFVRPASEVHRTLDVDTFGLCLTQPFVEGFLAHGTPEEPGHPYTRPSRGIDEGQRGQLVREQFGRRRQSVRWRSERRRSVPTSFGSQRVRLLEAATPTGVAPLSVHPNHQNTGTTAGSLQ